MPRVHPEMSRWEFSFAQLSLLEKLAATLLDSLEMAAVSNAILTFFVPQIAAHAQIWLRDEWGNERLAAPTGGVVLDGCAEQLPLIADGTELGTLCLRGPRAMSEYGPEFLQTAADRCARALANARLFEREQRASYTFQNAAIVSQLPRVEYAEFDAIYVAGRAEALVGGDWYDAFCLNDGRIIVSIGDVAGSGLDAAVAMVNVRQALRAVAHVHADPVLMLEAADRAFQSQYPDRYVTTFVAVIDPVTQLCAYANAGHPAPVLRSPDGSVQQLGGRGVPIGTPSFSANLETHHVQMPCDSLLVLYTDGLTEFARDVIEGERRLFDAIENVLPSTPHVARAIYDMTLPSHARDDVAILTVHFKIRAAARRWRFDPKWSDAARRARDEMAAALHDGSFGYCADSFNFEMIFAEVTANLIRHAPGTVEMLLENRSGRPVLHVLDKGRGFHFLPRLPGDIFSEHGRGLFLIERLARAFTVERKPGGGSHARIIL